MMKQFVAIGTRIVEQAPAVKAEFVTLQSLVAAKQPK
jgi:hypothetical protein